MKYQWIWFAALLGVAAALPTQSHVEREQLIKLFESKTLGRNSAIENIIISALESFRDTMVAGTENIPVLDPLHVEHVFVDDSVLPFPGARVEMNNMLVSKLSTFELQEVAVANTNIVLQRYNAQIQGMIPLIDVDVEHYDLSVNFWGLNIFGRGDAKISITKPWIKVDTNVNIRLGLLAMHLNVRDIRFDFGLEDIQFNINGMFNNPTVDDFVNRFLRNLILELAEFWVNEISDLISPIIVDVANDILRDINLLDLISSN